MAPSAQTVRFGPFELDLRAAEVRHNGTKIKLPEQPFQVLCELVEHPGEVVTREELRQRLWRSDTFVDFEHGLNTAVKRLREALGDSAENPRYIETLPRHGYRLMVPVEKPAASNPRPSNRRRSIWLTGLAVALIAVVAGLLGRQRLVEHFWPAQIESLAVLPLENLSGNPEQEYFADGMTEALITELGKVHALRVISRRSVMRYKGTTKPVPQIARELHVDAVLEGSALRAGGNVRITVQLIQANPERHLWSEGYERNLTDVIALQHEVAQAIVRELRVSLIPQQHALGNASSVSPEAYDSYLKGYFFLRKMSPEGIKRSFDFFQQAISQDPGYGPAYVGLGQAYILSGDRHVLPPKEAYAKALPLIMKALSLDDTLSEAHSSLAFILQTNWDWAGAEREYLRAIGLEPGDARAHQWYGIFLEEMGRNEAALVENRRARQLDPTARGINAGLAINLAVSGHPDEALEEAKAAVEMDDQSAPAHMALGLVYTKKHMAEEAIREVQRAVALSEGNSGYKGFLAYSYAKFGQAAEACRVAEQMNQQAALSYVAPSDLATAHLGCGRKEEAFQYLEKGYREHDPSLGSIKGDFTLDELRPDPRFQELLRRMNFPP